MNAKVHADVPAKIFKIKFRWANAEKLKILFWCFGGGVSKAFYHCSLGNIQVNLFVSLARLIVTPDPRTKIEYIVLVACQWGNTRSHSEHGSQAHESRWYSQGESR